MFATRTETSLLVAFLDLSGYAVQGTRTNDLDLAETLDEYFALVTDLVEGGGGTLVKLIGDAMLVVASPSAADTFVSALLEAKAAVDGLMQERHWGCRLVVRVHHGPVVAGPLGPAGHRRFDLVGRTVNTAARLESHGFALSAQAFRTLSPASRQRFKKHTPPITYIRSEDAHRA